MTVERARSTRGRRVATGALVLALIGAGSVVGAAAAQAYSVSGCKWPGTLVNYTNITTGAYLTASSAGVTNWSASTDVNLFGSAGRPFLITTAYANNGTAGWTNRVCNGFGTITQATSYGNTYTIGAYSANCKRWTYTHEIGHGLGLDHSSLTSTIMYSAATACVYYGIYYLQPDDIAGMNSIY